MGGSLNLAPNSILMVLVDLDVHQIVGYHYFSKIRFELHNCPSQYEKMILKNIGILKDDSQ